MSRELLHQIGTVVRVFFARMRFLAVFLVVGLVVGYWDNIKNYYDRWTRPAVAPDALAAVSNIEYYCPMHPKVRSDHPGNCPSCGMPLVKREKGKSEKLPDDVLARVQLSPQQITLAGVGTSAVEYRPLVREIDAVGVLDYNETKVAQLSARIAGRADELFIGYAGQAVKQNDPVYSIYSPDLYTAQREYLLARKRVNELPADAAPDTRADATAVYNASLQKLVLWGITREQLDHIEKEYDQSGKIPTHLTIISPMSGIVIRKDIFEGGYVQVGDRPYTVADLSTLWLKAKIYEQDVPLVHIGQLVDVVVDAFPNEVFKGTVTFRAFQLDPETRTLDARIEVKNADLRLRPGMFANASIREPIVLTASAASPATQPAVSAFARARTFQAGLAPYMQAQETLAADKADKVSELLHESVAKLQPLSSDPQTAAAYKRYAEAVHQTKGQDIKAIRQGFKEISAALIEMGKIAGVPADAPGVEVYRCPMVKANWIQKSGTTANPYYGSEMLECGGPIEKLPRIAPIAIPTTRPAVPAGKVLSIPRSAVIDTGHRKIAYVESSPGVYDMRAVTLGPAAGAYYAVAGGLDEGDRVVTAGAFLIDAENRLNPSEENAAAASAPAGHQH